MQFSFNFCIWWWWWWWWRRRRRRRIQENETRTLLLLFRKQHLELELELELSDSLAYNGVWLLQIQHGLSTFYISQNWNQLWPLPLPLPLITITTTIIPIPTTKTTTLSLLPFTANSDLQSNPREPNIWKQFERSNIVIIIIIFQRNIYLQIRKTNIEGEVWKWKRIDTRRRSRSKLKRKVFGRFEKRKSETREKENWERDSS